MVLRHHAGALFEVAPAFLALPESAMGGTRRYIRSSAPTEAYIDGPSCSAAAAKVMADTPFKPRATSSTSMPPKSSSSNDGRTGSLERTLPRDHPGAAIQLLQILAQLFLLVRNGGG